MLGATVVWRKIRPAVRALVWLTPIVLVPGIGVAAPATTPAAGAVAAVSPTAFPIPGHGDVLLRVPDGWGYRLQAGSDERPGTVELFAGTPRAFSVQVSFIPVNDAHKGTLTPAGVRKVTEAAGERMLPTSKEKALDLVELKSDRAIGYSFTVTDQAPDPGSFEYATSAFVACGDVLLATTILHHEKNTPLRQTAIDMLRTVDLVAAKNNRTPWLQLRAPLGDWSIRMPGEGFTLAGLQFDPSHKRTNLMAVNEKTGVNVSIFLEIPPKPGDAAAAREFYWSRAKQSPMPKQDIKLSDVGDFKSVEYLVSEMQGLTLNQKNANYYGSHDGIWIDIHVSKTSFADKDRPLFDAIIKGTTFESPAKKR